MNDPFMDPKKLPTLEDLRGAPVRLSYHKVKSFFWFVSRETFFFFSLFRYCIHDYLGTNDLELV